MRSTRFLVCAHDNPDAPANCSQWRSCTSLKRYLLPSYIAIFAVSVGYTAVHSRS
jgi:hypothetical protein